MMKDGTAHHRAACGIPSQSGPAFLGDTFVKSSYYSVSSNYSVDGEVL